MIKQQFKVSNYLYCLLCWHENQIMTMISIYAVKKGGFDVFFIQLFTLRAFQLSE